MAGGKPEEQEYSTAPTARRGTAMAVAGCSAGNPRQMSGPTRRVARAIAKKYFFVRAATYSAGNA